MMWKMEQCSGQLLHLDRIQCCVLWERQRSHDLVLSLKKFMVFLEEISYMKPRKLQ